MRTIDACLRFFQDERPRKKVSVTPPPSLVVVALRTPSLKLKDQPLMAHPLGKRQSSRRRSDLGGALFPPGSLFSTRRWAVLFMAPVAAVPFLIVVLRCPAFILYIFSSPTTTRRRPSGASYCSPDTSAPRGYHSHTRRHFIYRVPQNVFQPYDNYYPIGTPRPS